MNQKKLYELLYERNYLISIIVLFLCILPIFKYDYVVADNARAFLYNQGSNNWNIFLGCLFHRIPFDVLTGRPLVSLLGECHEAYLVSKIEDLYYLRYFSFFFICINIFFLSKIFEKTELKKYKYLIGVFFFLSPGYFYMVNLGLNGLPAQMALLLSILAVLYINKCENYFDTKSILAGFFFIFANLIFPSFAFFSIILILIDILLKEKINTQIISASLKKILFFIFCTLIYFIFSKFLILILNNLFNYYTHLSMQPGYNFSINTNFLLIFDKLKYFFKYKLLFEEIYENSKHLKFPTLGLDLISLILINIIVYKKVTIFNKNIKIINFLITMTISLVFLLGSISPWLFSNTISAAPHYFLPTFIFTPIFIFILLVRLNVNKTISFLIITLIVFFFNFSFLKTAKFMTLGDSYIKKEVEKFFYDKHYLNKSQLLIITDRYSHEEALGIVMASLNDDYIKSISKKKKLIFCNSTDKDCRSKNADKVIVNIVTKIEDFKENVNKVFIINLTEIIADKNIIFN